VRQRQALVGRLHHVDEALEFGDGRIDIDALFLQKVDPRLALFDGDAALRGAIVVAVVKIDHLADLREAETHPLAAQDPGEAGAVAPRIDPGQAVAAGRDQPFILVEAQRPRGHTELVAQVGDGVALSARIRHAEVRVHRGLGHGARNSLRSRQRQWRPACRSPVALRPQ
jgi:hypothetical protein